MARRWSAAATGWTPLLEALPYAARFARLGKIRSAGITDLRYGNLLDEDWEKRDRFEPARDDRRAVPLPDGVECYAMAATTGKKTGRPQRPAPGRRSRLREQRAGPP